MQSNIRNSALKVLEAAHLSAAEQPEEFAKVVLDFLTFGSYATVKLNGRFNSTNS